MSFLLKEPSATADFATLRARKNRGVWAWVNFVSVDSHHLLASGPKPAKME
jgi:hypothetical protein